MLNKRAIFTVTTGRSGTGYLTKILSLIPNVISVHEPEPKFSNVMREAQSNSLLGRKFISDLKIPAINAHKKPVYIETSHIFCKGFYEIMVEEGWLPEIIILKRNFRKVSLSLLSLNTIPGRTLKGDKFYLRPDDPTVLKIPNWKSLSDYQICYWYCLEIERRMRMYESKTIGLGGLVSKLDFNNMFQYSGLKKISKDLNIPRVSLLKYIKFYFVANGKTNAKESQKNKNLIPEDQLLLEEQQIMQIFNECLEHFRI